MDDYEIRTVPTVRDLERETVIRCLHCGYTTSSFWSLHDSERQFLQHFQARHPK